MSKKKKLGDTPDSWYCVRCQQEVYQIRCKYCGKSKREAK